MKHSIYQIKLDAISQVIDHGRLISDVARDFRISKKKLFLWLRDVEKGNISRNENGDVSSEAEALRFEISYLAAKLIAVEAKRLS